jgi:XTP/dITP diphosphohydrolase
VRVVLATGNKGKVREFGRLLAPLLILESLPDSLELPAETGTSFHANARLKAESVAEALGWAVAVLADDSGLEVGALDGRPGVLSARFAGEGACDEENTRKLLGELEGVSRREARFVCALCLALPETTPGRHQLVEVEGVLCGEITLEPRGHAGFGYDPVFRPDGWSHTLAEARAEDKDRVSHRGAASRELVRVLTGDEAARVENRGLRGL